MPIHPFNFQIIPIINGTRERNMELDGSTGLK